jgi:hypothetical protein
MLQQLKRIVPLGILIAGGNKDKHCYTGLMIVEKYEKRLLGIESTNPLQVISNYWPLQVYDGSERT